ncbi:YARHG domain-containing protein [uncultured Lacinutrix sp.]|uniref:YARHG domain-containing protein n=1 Tax=uncultured Lacinutrix sp. TaxID=574032 RepID=UPI00260E0FCE|nr:YARHG domain-containing protein [uncultured Lacinutrix sp.]
MKLKKLLFLLLLVSLNAFSQILAGEEINENNLSSWHVNNIDEYEGIYAIGFSEAEAELTVAIHNNLICVQLKSGDWLTENEQTVGWRTSYLNYTNIKIDGNKFYSDETNGEFVIYKIGNKMIKCLKLNIPPVQTGTDNQYEIARRFSIGEITTGKHIKTKFEVSSPEYLMSLSLVELKIMRNEIFARYGYTFKKGGAMHIYFNEQDWYKAEFNNVDAFITAIEKLNIAEIKKIEALKMNN